MFLMYFKCETLLKLLSNIFSQRITAIRKYKKSAPIILVATKIDVRKSENLDALYISDRDKDRETKVTTAEGESLAKRMKSTKFIECSALSKVSLY